MYDADKIIDRLLQLIESKGTRADINRKSGVSCNTMYYWRKKRYLPQMATFIELLKAVKPTAEELLWLMDYESAE